MRRRILLLVLGGVLALLHATIAIWLTLDMIQNPVAGMALWLLFITDLPVSIGWLLVGQWGDDWWGGVYFAIVGSIWWFFAPTLAVWSFRTLRSKAASRKGFLASSTLICLAIPVFACAYLALSIIPSLFSASSNNQPRRSAATNQQLIGPTVEPFQIERLPAGLSGQIAYLHAGTVHVLDFANAETTNFDFDRAMDDPAWLPNGEVIAYGAGTVRLLDTKTMQIAEAVVGSAPAWHPNSESFVITRVTQGRGSEIEQGGLFVVSVDPTFVPPPPDDIQVELLEDGTQITRVGPPLLPAPASVREVQILDDALRPYHPVWSPDGTLLVFSGYQAGYDNRSWLFALEPATCANDDGSYDVAACAEAVQVLARGAPNQVGPATRNDYAAFSPDGAQLAFRRGRGIENHIVLLALATGSERVLTPPGAEEVYSTWGPDSRYLVVSRRTPGQGSNTNLFLYDLQSGDVTQLTIDGGAKPDWWWPGRYPSGQHDTQK